MSDANIIEINGIEVNLEDAKAREDITNINSQLGDIAKQIANILQIIQQGGNFDIKINSILDLKDNWKFKLISNTSNSSYSSTIEAGVNFDDTSWDSISIPHDWSIYNRFNSRSLAGYEGGYLDGGDAWYRRKINTSSYEGQIVGIYFDGIYMESDIYINGTKVKDNKWYNPFYIDATEYLNFDGTDTLAIFVRNNQPSSRWYSGSGIIRNAYLVVGNKLSIGINDIDVSSPNLELETEKDGDVTTNISIKLTNSELSTNSIKIKNTIYYNDSEVVSNTIEKTLIGVENETVETTLTVNKPTLWNEYEGNLYTLKTEILNPIITHSVKTIFGYRYFKFDKDTGFWLNGNNIKLRGVCLHHDLGCLGAEVNKSAIERQIKIMKNMGCNAIRITHNPSSQEMLNVCAKEGMLVIEEFFDCWTSPKKTNDFARFYNTYAQNVIENTVNRGKNNPAIIMWSIGNEIIRTSGSYTVDIAKRYVQNMINWIKSIDTERMVTMGDDTPANSVSQAIMNLLDVVGVNYGNDGEYSNLRTAIPNKPVYGSETTSALSSRGIYTRDNTNKQCSSLDDDKVNWGDYASIALKRHMNSSYLAGMFVWTGFDYIGEPTPFNAYPSKSSYFGICDLCGFPKDIYYMYQSRWTTKPMIHILPHWDNTVGDIVKVWLYSNCYKVELFLNGKSLGEKLQTNIGSKYEFEYSVTYEKGTLVANGYDANGNVVAQDIIYTSKKPSKLKLSSDKSSVNIGSDDLVFITCEIQDDNNVFCPTSSNQITFTVEGGTIIGTDNGDATCVEKMRYNVKSAFSGKCLCIVKPNSVLGAMTITASSSDLTSAKILITKSNETIMSKDITSEFIDATNPTVYEYDDITDIPCTGISLSSSVLTFTDNTSQTLTATLTPVDTTDSVKWFTSDGTIATVDNGVVTPVSNGSCTITATCGNQSATCSVTVQAIDLSVTALNLDKDSIGLNIVTQDNVNYLEGVKSSNSSNGNINFNNILLDRGIYEYKNINGGTFTWLQFIKDFRGNLGDDSTNGIKLVITTDNTKINVNAYPNNDENNTSDKLGLYKINNIEIVGSTPLTKTGVGYFTRSSTTPVAGENDEYCIMPIDSTKTYAITVNDGITQSQVCIPTVPKTLSSGALETIIIQNTDTLYISVGKTTGITNLNLVELSTSNPTGITTYGHDTITATLTPSNASNQNVTWESSDNTKVTIEPKGLSCKVTAKAVGSATITCTSEDTTNGTIKDTCNATVTN